MNRVRLLTFLLVTAVTACGPATSGSREPVAAPPDKPALPEADATTTTTTAPPTTAQTPTVVLELSGTGTKNSQEFTVGGRWDVAWSYDCAAANNAYMKTGNFIVMPKGDAFVSGMVNELGASGSDVQHYFEAGTFHLEIVSMCPWKVTVTSL